MQNQDHIRGHEQNDNRGFLYLVFGWMAIGLTITAAAAYFVSLNPAFSSAIIRNPMLLFTLIFAQLALVILLSFGINRLSYTTALAAFFVYALLTGITLSWIFQIFTVSSIYRAFIATAGMFGAMAFYGYYTQSDLSSLGNILRMGLVGFIIALVLNIFFKSTAFDYIISVVGVVIFAGLTAIDLQKLKQLSRHEIIPAKASLLGALQLYLDVLNLFLSFLRLSGQQRE